MKGVRNEMTMNPAQKNGNNMFQPSKEIQLQMIIYELQQANFELQRQLADLRNQVLIRSELIAKIGPEWKFDNQNKTFTKAEEEFIPEPEPDKEPDPEPKPDKKPVASKRKK